MVHVVSIEWIRVDDDLPLDLRLWWCWLRLRRWWCWRQWSWLLSAFPLFNIDHIGVIFRIGTLFANHDWLLLWFGLCLFDDHLWLGLRLFFRLFLLIYFQVLDFFFNR